MILVIMLSSKCYKIPAARNRYFSMYTGYTPRMKRDVFVCSAAILACAYKVGTCIP